VIDSGEYHPCNSDNGSFFSSSFRNAFIFNFVVRRFIRFHGCMGNLHQCRFEVNTGTCNADRFLLTTLLITSRISLLPGVNPAQQHKRLELEKWAISVPISEMIVIAEVRSTPGMVQIRVIALS